MSMSISLQTWLAEQVPEADEVTVEGLDKVEMGHSAEMFTLTMVTVTDGVEQREDIVVRLRPPEPGLLEPYDSPSAADIPELFRDPERRWTGFAARARVLIVNTDLVPAGDEPKGTLDLFDPKWSEKCGIARPLTGTTLTS